MASIELVKEENKMAKKDVVEKFKSLKRVGESKAELLYDSGFDSLDKLKKASIEDLTKVKGISENIAIDIKDQLKKKTKTSPEKKQPKPEDIVKKKTEKIKTKKEETKIIEKEEKELELDEKEEIYKAKQKPDISKEQKEKLSIRKQIKKRTPEFIREEWFRYKRIPRVWRRPDGITSKMRVNLKYRPNKVRVGYRGPKDVRGLHSSGFREVAIQNVHDLEDIDPKTQAVRIGSTVGTKKRIDIEKKAEELNIRILNI
jgi:large subunit ribosomal protein L32e